MASTATKVVLGIGCVMLLAIGGGLATCAGCVAWFANTATHGNSSSSAPAPLAVPLIAPGTPPEDASFKLANSKNAMAFVVVDQALGKNLLALRARAWNFCEVRRPQSQCLVLMWPKQSLVPKTARVSDRQARAMVAYYVRSSDKMHDCLQLVRNGSEEENAGECGSPAVGFEAEVNAWEACKQRVLAQLRAPSTAEFLDDSGIHHVFREKMTGNPAQKAVSLEARWEFGFTHYIVQGEVDAQNAFGAKLRSPFECSVTRTKEDRWMVMKARIFTR